MRKGTGMSKWALLVSGFIAATSLAQTDLTKNVSTTATANKDAETLPRLLVSDVVAQGVAKEEADAFSDALVTVLSARGVFNVVSNREIQALLSAERRRQILGLCVNDEEACASNLGEVSGARFVLTSTLSKLGDTYQLALQMLDTVKGRPTGRSSRLSNSLAILRAQLPYAAAEATGSPLPPPPSRVLPITLVSVGGASVIAGGVVGMLALSRQSVLSEELCPQAPVGNDCTGQNLRDLPYYREQDAQIATQKYLAIGLLAGGAALTITGAFLFPPPEGGPRVAFVPAHNGGAIVGTF